MCYWIIAQKTDDGSFRYVADTDCRGNVTEWCAQEQDALRFSNSFWRTHVFRKLNITRQVMAIRIRAEENAHGKAHS